MKKCILTGLCLLLLVGCSFEKEKKEEPKKLTSNSNIEENAACTSAPVAYKEEDKRTLYLICLEDIHLTEENVDKNLFTYMSEHDYSIQDLSMGWISDLPLIEEIPEVGVSIYRGKMENYEVDEEITFIACNTQDGNRDVYIGPATLDYRAYIEKGICQNDEI